MKKYLIISSSYNGSNLRKAAFYGLKILIRYEDVFLIRKEFFTECFEVHFYCWSNILLCTPKSISLENLDNKLVVTTKVKLPNYRKEQKVQMDFFPQSDIKEIEVETDEDAILLAELL